MWHERQKSQTNGNEGHEKARVVQNKRKEKRKGHRKKEGAHTSLGHLIRPICLSTRRSLSLSLCLSPVWPSLPEGWGGTNKTSHKRCPPRHLPLPPDFKKKEKNGDENVFSISGVHTVPGSLNGFMVRLLLKACLWQLSNPCFHSTVGWCQTPAKTRTTDGRAAREEKEEVRKGPERVWTHWGIPVERTSCVFSCVNAQGRTEMTETQPKLSVKVQEMKYFTTSSKSCSSLQAREQTPAQPLIYTGEEGGRGGMKQHRHVFLMPLSETEGEQKSKHRRESKRTGGSNTVATATSRSNSVGDPCPSVSPAFPTLHRGCDTWAHWQHTSPSVSFLFVFFALSQIM